MDKKVFAVIKREYVTRVRTKGFIIGTLLFPLMLILIFGGIFIFSVLFQPSTKSYYVVDQTGFIFRPFSEMLSDTLETGEPKYIFTEKTVSDRDIDDALKEYQGLVLSKEIDGYLVIPNDLIESRKINYSARSVSNFEEQGQMAGVISQILTNVRLESKGLSPEEIREEMMLGRVRLESLQVTEEGEIQKSGAASFGLTYVLTYIMLLMIMIYGIMMMRSVIEEKSQRITETIISSLRPIDLMVGKLVGICSLGITQLAVIGIFISLAVTYGETIFVKFGVQTPAILEIIRQVNFSPIVFGFLVLYFVMGFIFYASLYAAVGAIVNTEDEGQQFQTPIVFLIMIGFFIMFSVAQNPDTTMAYWVSLIPFVTPLVMFARITVSDPFIPDGTYLSIFTMLLSIVLMIMFVAKIYRVGILMYGKKPSIKEIIKWIRHN